MSIHLDISARVCPALRLLFSSWSTLTCHHPRTPLIPQSNHWSLPKPLLSHQLQTRAVLGAGDRAMHRQPLPQTMDEEKTEGVLHGARPGPQGRTSHCLPVCTHL